MRHRTIYPRRETPDRLQDALHEQLERGNLRTARPFGHPTDVHAEDVQAALGDLVRVDPRSGAMTVRLQPLTRPEQLGGVVSIVNVTNSTNTVTVVPADAEATIDGDPSAELDWAYGPPAVFLAATLTLWVSLRAQEVIA